MYAVRAALLEGIERAVCGPFNKVLPPGQSNLADALPGARRLCQLLPSQLWPSDLKSIAASGWGPELIPDDDILQSQFPQVLAELESPARPPGRIASPVCRRQ